MQRRNFIFTLGGIALLPLVGSRLLAKGESPAMSDEKLILTEAEWRERLTPEQFNILREEGTERPWTSSLLEEKRDGTFLCVGCDNPLFSSATKYDSGTGWPSFFDVLEGAFETRRDFKLIWPRTEYHCARCGGHHGHVFDDGPKPTGLRYCNNGAVLKFQPA
jgi:peptide-methionine (R)-S-oxide reductase